MFSDPERRHETEITIQGLKQVFIFYSVHSNVSLILRLVLIHSYCSHDRRDSGVMLSNMGAYNEAFDPTADNPERRYSELTMPRTSMQPSRDVVFTNLSCVSTDTEGYEKIDIKHVAPNGSQKSDEFTNSGYVAVEKPHSDRYSENQTQQSRLPVSFMITENPAYSELPSVRPRPSAGGPPSRNRLPQIIQEESEMDNEYSYVKIA